MITTLTIHPTSGVFVEDKEEAQRLRQEFILPALQRGDYLALDFEEVQYATQSFIHTLLSEPLKRFPETALQLIEFRHCSSAIRTVVEWVVDYSINGFANEDLAAGKVA